MESSAERALEIGVNVFIFIIALTCAITLMTSVLNMSELASDIIKDTSSSTLMELYGDTTERIYTGEQIKAIFNKYTSNTNNIHERIVLKFDKGGVISDVTAATTMRLSDFNAMYNLTYGGIDPSNKKQIYIFSKIIDG